MESVLPLEAGVDGLAPLEAGVDVLKPLEAGVDGLAQVAQMRPGEPSNIPSLFAVEVCQ